MSSSRRSHPRGRLWNRGVMEARSVDSIPTGETWQYEPKWDGFRCLLAREGASVHMVSKSGQDLRRYFPEIARQALAFTSNRFVLDGELVVPDGKHFSFDRLLQRIHPAESRVQKLAHETPALFLAFDFLENGRRELALQPLPVRRAALEAFANSHFSSASFYLSPASMRLAQARRWLKAAGGGSDGVIAKRRDLPYQFGNRDGMQKIKKLRSADCIVGGFRYAERRTSGRKVAASLLLGLYDDQRLLHHVGFTSALTSAEKPALTDRLEAIATDNSFSGNSPGGPSRWSTKRSASWVPVRPRLVVEISYDHFTGGRFRHGTTIMRWRPDKIPAQCTFIQLEQKAVLPRDLLRATR